MKLQYERALALLQVALEPLGGVSWEAPDRVVVYLTGNAPFVFRLSQLPDTDEIGDSHSTIWLLRRPRRAVLADLRARSQSFVSLDGTVRIEAPGVLIDRSGLEPPVESRADSKRSAFSDRASRIARTLFTQPAGRQWSLTELADLAGVSASVASYAVNDLAERGIVLDRREGRQRRLALVDHRQLITQWAREYSWRDNMRIAVRAPVGSIPRFLGRLPSFDLPRSALTLHAGASRVTPHAPVEEIALYLDVPSHADLHGVARRLDWPPDPAGLVSFVLPYHKDSVWVGVREVGRGLVVVSNLQLILDLWDHPVRGREQADVLLEKHLSRIAPS